MRVLIMGDPQASFEQVMSILRRHDALARDRLAPDVVLVSVGDHFDYDGADARGEGMRVLRFLASHPPDQAYILFGNHDASRVMELIALSDSEFEAAQTLARDIAKAPTREMRDARERAEFLPAFPNVATHGLVARDYSSYSTEQRALVIELLLANRFRLAIAVELMGQPALVTHAGITTRELALLGGAVDAVGLASRLDAELVRAVDAVRADWTSSKLTPLSLEPLHIAGSKGEEGGGLLYHRPSAHDGAWERDPAHPRRFDPRMLPAGLVQVAGHTGHKKCCEELGEWAALARNARPRGGIRTLAHAGGNVRYELGVSPDDGDAALVLVDGEMRYVQAAEYDLLPVTRIFA